MPPNVVFRLASLLIAAGLTWAPCELPAQVVQGQVVGSVSGMPVARGFVVLLDPLGNEVARSLSSGEGKFTLRAPSGGRYQLRSERIGFRAFLSDFLNLADGQTVDFDLRIEALPILLASVIVPGRDRCNTNPEQGESTVLVWEEIRKALAAAVWADEQELFHYRKYSYRRELDARRTSTIAETGSTRSGVTDPPFRSVPAEQLAREGYIAQRGDDTWYYLPDAYTLLDEDFLDTHCFHVVRDKGERPGLVGLAFEPMSDRRLPDVEGTLWLDEASSELRELEVRHTRVRNNVRDERIGGTVSFLMLPSGAWIVREWQVRTPKITVTEEVLPVRRHTAEVDGFTDTGGEIYRVSTRDGTTVFEAPVATVNGTVFDSTSAARLGGAFVTVVGTNFRAQTDSAGRFELGVPLEGEYSLTLSHPRLDSVAAPDQVETVELVRDYATEVTFALPHVRSSLRRLCGRAVRSPDTRVIFGVVRNAESSAPTNRAKVSASWQSIDLSRRVAVVSNLREEVNTDDSGFFAICNVPAGRRVRLSAEKDGRTSREASLIFPDQPGDHLSMAWDRRPGEPYDHEYAAPEHVWKVDLTVGDPRRETIAGFSSLLHGIVTDSASGEPLAGVTVVLNDSRRTVSAADGTYQLANVAWRQPSNQIEYRRLGYAPGIVEAQINSAENELMLNAALPRLAIRMTEVVVEGERLSVPARLAGFYQRQEVGIGEFLTEKDWEELPTSNVAHVLSRMPGVAVAGYRVLMDGATFTCRRQGTSARIWVNGVSVHYGFIQDMNIDDVVAIEVYRRIADIPVQYNSSADQGDQITGLTASSSACGVVLIWTK